MLDAGADIEANRADMQTPLHLAIEGGDYWYRKKHEPDPNTTSKQVVELIRDRGATYEFSNAVAMNDLDRVKFDLAKDPELASQLNASRRSPLYLAARRGHMDMVRLLLEHGAEPNLAEHCASTGRALFEASARNDIEMMKLLIEHGANADAYVDSCGNCLSIAQQGGDREAEAIELLKKHGGLPGEWELKTVENIAAALDDESFIPNRDMWSSVLGQIIGEDSVELLEKYVARFGTDDIVRLNPAKAGGFRSQNRCSQSCSNTAPTSTLVTGTDARSCTTLPTVNQSQSLSFLIEAGIDIDAIDHQSGTTALGLAAWNGGLAMVDFLLTAGANSLLPENNKLTRPLAFATAQGHDEIAAKLKQHGAT